MTAKPTKGRIRPLLSGLILRSQTDERLGLLAGAGNEQAFSTIYERYQRELGSHARRIVRADRADDLVQHAMLAAWTALLGGTEISDLRAWLHRVVHNAALDTVTRRGYDDSDIPYSAIAPARIDELAEGRLSAASALAAIAALPESQRRALTLTAVEGRSGHDAALEMGISESAMRQLVYRARSGVRGAITALVPLPLISRLVEAAGAPPAAIAVGAAGGGAASVAKIVGAIGIAAATVGAPMRSEATTSQDMPRARAAAAWRRPRRRNATTRPRSGFSAPRSSSPRRPRPCTPPAGSPAPSSKPAGRTVRQSLPRTDRQSVPRTDRQVVVRVGHGNRAPATTRPINQGLGTRRAGPTVSSPEPSNRPRPPLTQPALHPARAPVSSRSKAPKPAPVPRPANPTRIRHPHSRTANSAAGRPIRRLEPLSAAVADARSPQGECERAGQNRCAGRHPSHVVAGMAAVQPANPAGCRSGSAENDARRVMRMSR